jgi:hypothetical protein
MKYTLDEFLMGREKQYPIDEDMRTNAQHTLTKLNEFMSLFYAANSSLKKLPITSGYRPAAINEKTANSAKKSNHMVCLAADIFDPERKLAKFCLDNLDKLAEIGLWVEDFRWTPNWTHFQIVSPKSGKRVFVPSTTPAKDPSFWDGNYDSKHDKVS